MTLEKCPRCGSKCIEEHGINPGDHHWWLCINCSAVIDDKVDTDKADISKKDMS